MMLKISSYLPFFLLFVLFSSCEKDNFMLEGRMENNLTIAPLKYEVLVDEGNRVYEVKAASDVEQFAFSNIISVSSLSQGQEGPVLYLGIGKRPVNQDFREYFPFSLKFRVDEFDPEVDPGAAALLDYFAIGREFSFGEANGEVQLGLLLPDANPEDYRSRSDFLESPEGMARVEKIEPFSVELPESAGGAKEYQMITFSFEGKIGIHSYIDEVQAQRQGVKYVAANTANVSGSATLVLAAKPY